MKIFQAIDNPYNAPNPYVYTLIDGLKVVDSSIEIGWGIDTIWTDDILNYDIVHIHWPSSLLYNNDGVVRQICDVEERLVFLKSKGIRIVATCHNLEPHYCAIEEERKSYHVVYGLADMIFHLGEYSKNLFGEKYPNARNVMLPHHIYDTVYKDFKPQEESQARLGLRMNNKYILCFGAFRNIEEHSLVLQLGAQFKRTNIYILAPSYDWIPKARWYSFNKQRFLKQRLKFKYHLIVTGTGGSRSVSDEELPYYYAASDLCLIHRVKILNSGLLPMAMMMGKTVIGPDAGNVGCILRGLHNPVFDVDNLQSLGQIIKDTFKRGKEIGLRNQEYAFKHWRTSDVSGMLYNYYMSLMESIA